MTVKNVEKKENSTAIFQVEIDADAFESAVNSAYKRLKGQIYVAGFRKGKAPRAVIEGMYGHDIFHEEAVQILAPDAFEQAVGFFPMMVSPDTLVLGKLAEGADTQAVKTALEAYRQSQEDTFSWYLSQNLPKVQDARLLVQDGYVLFLIAENADAGEAAFTAALAALD